MSDLQTRFRTLDDLPAPDLWREAEIRAQASQRGATRSISWVLIALIVLLTLAISSAALVGLGIVKLPAVVEPSPGPSTDATVEPASGRIAFGRYDRFLGDFVVYLIDPSGSGETMLLPGAHEAPRWSPDGRDIAMTSAGIFVNAGQPGGSFRAFTTFDGTRYLPDPTLNLGCTVWTPDASRLACEGWDDSDPTRNGVYTVSSSDGGDLRRLTSNPDGGHDGPGDYSTDGTQLFFGRENGPVMVVSTDGSDPRPVTSDSYGAPSLSPDGRTLLVARDGRLYLIAVAGGVVTPITIFETDFNDASGGSWSSDGKWIVLSLAIRPGQWDIYRMRPDGSSLFQITNNGADEEFGDWAP